MVNLYDRHRFISKRQLAELAGGMHPTPFGENLLAPTNAGVLSIPKKRG